MKKLLEAFFALVGWPINLRSNGGPFFAARHFEKFCVTNRVRHCKSAPGHHQSNGGAECGVREIKALMKTTQETGLAMKHLISQLNNMERAGGTGSPNQLFFGRTIRVPGIPALCCEEFDEKAAAAARHNQREKVRMTANRGQKPILKEFKAGDRVRFQVIFNGASRLQSYVIKAEWGTTFLRPSAMVAAA